MKKRWLSLACIALLGISACSNSASTETEQEEVVEETKQISTDISDNGYVTDEFPYLGFNMTTPVSFDNGMYDLMIARMSDGESYEDDTLKTGYIEYRYIPKEAREEVFNNEDEFYNKTEEEINQWVDEKTYTFLRVTTNADKENYNIEEQTGLSSNEEVNSSDGYTTYVSTQETPSALEGEDKTQFEEYTAAIPDIIKSMTFSKPEPVNPNVTTYDLPLQNAGEKVEAFTTTDLAGETVDNTIFANADLTVVNVWATTCSPCIDEMPDLAALSEEWKDKGVQIVGLAADVQEGQEGTEYELAKTIVEKTGVTYPILLNNAAIGDQLVSGLVGVPGTYFVDAAGNFVGGLVSGSQSKEKWAEIFEERLALLSSGEY
jgi:thiol-disulfide isomerase/thioredoxin